MYCLLRTLLLFGIFQLYSGEECTTPKSEKGICISIYNCEELYKVLASQNESQYDHVKNSQCGFDGDIPLVCCPNRKVSIAVNTRGDFLKNKQFCGYQHYDDYIPSEGPKKATIDEFPWLASLLYLKPSVKGFSVLCNGALISERYVLTVAHCTMGPNINLVGVRLGEHNLKQDRDCTDSAAIEDCSDPVVEYAIEKIIRHPGYSYRYKTNDIALIKLNKTVTFSDFIRPICLPTAGTTLAKPGESMTVSGWGSEYFSGAQVSVKKKILVELISEEQCQRLYNKQGSAFKYNISKTQICTKERADTVDIACQGDSGGPTIFANKNQWHVEGLVSFGSGCGMGMPDINTRVVSYLDWIADAIVS